MFGNQETIFSVYKTEQAIELHRGCQKRENARLIATQKSYEDAYEFCLVLAQGMGLPLRDFSRDFPCSP